MQVVLESVETKQERERERVKEKEKNERKERKTLSGAIPCLFYSLQAMCRFEQDWHSHLHAGLSELRGEFLAALSEIGAYRR